MANTTFSRSSLFCFYNVTALLMQFFTRIERPMGASENVKNNHNKLYIYEVLKGP